MISRLLFALFLFFLLGLLTVYFGFAAPEAVTREIVLDSPEFHEKSALLNQHGLSQEDFDRVLELSEITLRQIKEISENRPFPAWQIRSQRMFLNALIYIAAGIFVTALNWRLSFLFLVPGLIYWSLGWYVFIEVVVYFLTLQLGVGFRRLYLIRYGGTR